MDFGTTNSGIARYDGARLQLLPLDPAAPQPTIARTALYLTHDRQLHFGRAAITRYYEQNLNRPVQMERVYVGEIELTFAELPTFLRDVYIERDVFSPGRLFLSLKSSLASRGYVGTAVGEDFYLLEDIIALYLYSARRRAERELAAELREVVLGRPVRYADDEEQDALAQARMLQAAFAAGFERVHFVYEPVAAAHAYTQRAGTARGPRTLLIFDFGGGTLDISMVRSEGRTNNAPTVLATGGIAIAGDRFDSRIVRRKLTAPFGEGSHYYSDGRPLPLPAAYYDAFASWQDLLALQQPNALAALRRIARSAEQPERIHSLIRLITSHFGLRLFDIAEAGKRQLSRALQTRLALDEEGLAFSERLSRREFERLIRPDLRKISACLDEVLAAAGLRSQQVDAVLRTGGSAQIPCFVALLAERFGAEKVRAMDTFSSVTAGLAIIAHHLGEGLPPGTLASADHTPDSEAPPSLRETPAAQKLPRVPLQQLQQLIDLRGEEESATRRGAGRWLIGRAGEKNSGERRLVSLPPADPKAFAQLAPQPPVRLLPGDERLVLLTNAPRLLARPARWLAELAALGTSLEEFERFERDAFGQEEVSYFCAWSELAGARRLSLLTTRAHAHPLATEHTLQRLRLSATLRVQLPPRLGEPLALLPLHEGGSLILMTAAGRLVRIAAAALLATEARGPLLSLTGRARLSAALSLRREGHIVGGRADGRLHWRRSEEVPRPAEAALTLRGAVALAHWEGGRELRALTNQRLLPVALRGQQLPLQPGERLLGFLTVNIPV